MQDKKTIPDFENYFVHKDGYVINIKSGRILKCNPVGKGYLTVTLSSKKSSYREYIHRLVAKAFLPNLENKTDVNHINGVRTDNRLENLEWTSRKENIHHAYETGLCPTNIKALQGSKLSEAEVLQIRELLKQNFSNRKIAALYNVHEVSISNIKRRITWNHL